MATDFRIATFNLESLDDSGPDLAARIAVLRPQLLRLEADILCLQEVNRQETPGGPRGLHALDRLLAGTPYADFARSHTTGRDGVAPLDVHNLVTLSRYPILRSTQLHHQLVAPPRHRFATAEPAADMAGAVAWDRPLLHVAVELAAGRPLHVLNLHLRSPLASPVPGRKAGPLAWKTAGGWGEGFFLSALKRSGQALEARLLVDRLLDAEPDALIAVCGDFNAELNEAPLRILRADPADTRNRELASRALVPVEGAADPSARFSVRHGARQVMLDHILVSRGLAPYCRYAEVHNEELRDETMPGADMHPDSFHAPVVAAFSLPR